MIQDRRHRGSTRRGRRQTPSAPIGCATGIRHGGDFVLVESGGPKAATAQVSPLPEVKLAPVALTAELLAWHAALNFDHGAEYMAHLILGMNDDIRALARPAWR